MKTRYRLVNSSHIIRYIIVFSIALFTCALLGFLTFLEIVPSIIVCCVVATVYWHQGKDATAFVESMSDMKTPEDFVTTVQLMAALVGFSADIHVISKAQTEEEDKENADI